MRENESASYITQLKNAIFTEFQAVARDLPIRIARLTEGKSTMKTILQSEIILNLFSHQAVGWTLVKVSSLCGYIRVLI